MRIYATTILTLLLTLLPSTGLAQEAAPTSTEEVDEKDPQEVLDKAHAWVLGFIVKNAPPGRKIWYEDGQETEEEALERYNDIAWDVVELAYSPDTKPLFKSTAHGRSQMASVWLGIMLHESGFMKHVDYNIGEYGRGDGGYSWCMMQLRLPTGRTVKWNVVEDRQPWYGDDPEDISEGVPGPDLIADRKNCIREAHKLVRLSVKSAEKAGLPFMEYLTSYTIGKSKVTNPDDPDDVEYVRVGKAKSRARMGSAFKYFSATKHSRGFRDEEVTEALEKRGPQPDLFVSREKEKGQNPLWISKPSPVAFTPQLHADMVLQMPPAMPKPWEAMDQRPRLLNFSPSAKLQWQESPWQKSLPPLRPPLPLPLLLPPPKTGEKAEANQTLAKTDPQS